MPSGDTEALARPGAWVLGTPPRVVTKGDSQPKAVPRLVPPLPPALAVAEEKAAEEVPAGPVDGAGLGVGAGTGTAGGVAALVLGPPLLRRLEVPTLPVEDSWGRAGPGVASCASRALHRRGHRSVMMGVKRSRSHTPGSRVRVSVGGWVWGDLMLRGR